MDKSVISILKEILANIKKGQQEDLFSELLTSNEVISRLGITEDTLCAYDKRGLTKPIWLDSSSRRKYYLRSDLNKLIKSRI